MVPVPVWGFSQRDLDAGLIHYILDQDHREGGGERRGGVGGGWQQQHEGGGTSEQRF